MPHGMKWLRAIAHNIKVQAHATWLCARDPELGWGPRAFALLIAGYALSPIDLIPDFIPVLGLLDDAILIPLGIWLFRKIVPPEIYARNLAIAQATGDRPVSRAGAAAIIGLWIGLALWFAYLFGATRAL
jgi:uncharacterized membrane protein YkvA (DUF1232 family)